MAVTKLEKIPLQELLEKLSPEVQQIVRGWVNNPGTSHAVLFENLDLSSSHLGDRAVLAIGPGCTYKTVDEIREAHLGAVPSVFQYPVYFAEV